MESSEHCTEGLPLPRDGGKARRREGRMTRVKVSEGGRERERRERKSLAGEGGGPGMTAVLAWLFYFIYLFIYTYDILNTYLLRPLTSR